MRQPLILARRLGVTAALLCAAANVALAQEAQPTEPSAPPATPSPDRPGFLDGLGKLLKGSADLLPSLSKPDAAQEAAPPPAETPAASTRLFPGMATGRETCPRSANGAPDCQAASDKLCQSRGYKGGKSLNTDSAYSCSARQARAEGGKLCGNEHFVTSAFCN